MMDRWFGATRRSLLLVGILFWPLLSQKVSADSLAEQRARYQQARVAWDNNDMDRVRTLMPTLKEYPLYPYLEYRQLTQDLTRLTIKEAEEFIQAHPTLPLNSNLLRNFSAELARRGDWQGLLTFVKEEPTAVATRCHYLYAKWMTGEKQQIVGNINEVWLAGKSLPSECDPLFNVWRQAGHQTVDIILQRILLAAQAGSESKGLVSFLIRQLPENQRALANAVVQLQEKPSELVEFAKQHTASGFTREVVLKTFPAFARQSALNARAAIPALVKEQQLTDQQRLQLEMSVVGRIMNNDLSSRDAEWRDAVILRSGDVTLMERRIRLALARADDKALDKWLAALPAEAKQKHEWLYWRAAMMVKDRSRRTEGEKILRELKTKRGFYPMMAAQKLEIPYVVRALQADHEQKGDRKLFNSAEVARVNELLYWNLENQARSEWIRFIGSLNQPNQELMARYAFERGWADLSVQATISARLWDHLEERFPMAYPELFRESLKDKRITKSFSMAVARQESAWNPQAQSPVGARGLMQLMPATAQETAKRSQLTSYSTTSQLFEPQINIALGTSYLDHVYQMFGNNRILAAAAYNAGPHRVNTWLKNSDGRLDAVAFVETIPFTETRNYVKNVLSYDVFYSHFMQEQKNVLTRDELQKRY